MKTLDMLRNDWMLATEINKLEARIWKHVQRDSLKVVLVTSAVRGEGKSTTVAYLATALGLYPDRKILAMDFDFRIPTLQNLFGAPVKTGLDQVLEVGASIDDVIINTGLPSLDLALPTPGGADPANLVRTPRMRAMFGDLREKYDLIILDSPAIIPVADATTLMPLADGVLLAAMAGKTTEHQLRRAVTICEGMDANIMGLIVGNVQEAAPEYLADGYEYYGKFDGQKRRKRSA